MIAPKLDDTNDLDFNPDTGTFEVVEDEEEISQKLGILVGTNLGELDWNENIGLNHIDVVLNGDDESTLQAILNDYLEEQWPDSFESVEVTAFKIDKQYRITKLAATVTLYDGRVINAQTEFEQEQEGDDEDAG